MLKMIVATAVVVVDHLDERHRGHRPHPRRLRPGRQRQCRPRSPDESQSFRLVAKAPIAFDW